MPSHGSNRPPRSAIASGRLGRIVRGYIGACFIAAWVLPFGLIFRDLVAARPLNGSFKDFGIVVGGFFLVMLVSAAPLATAAIVITESYRARLLWPFAAAGAIIGVIIQVASRFVGPSAATATKVASGHWTMLPLAAIVGAIAGVVYWMIAVRGYRSPQVRD